MPRILLVDDDEPFRLLLRITLVKKGYDVVEARGGKEALKLVAQEPPHLVMTDMIMPGEQGLEVIERLRHEHPYVKIIAMSGGGSVRTADYLQAAKAMGADRVLSKPFTNQEMFTALAELLGPDSS